jgi:hypothetical protein
MLTANNTMLTCAQESATTAPSYLLAGGNQALEDAGRHCRTDGKDGARNE